MKLIVFSDSHGAVNGIEEALALHPDAKQVLFLGDGVRSVEELSYCYPERVFHLLAGNCDFSSDKPSEAVWVIDGVRIFACHGHTLQVKYGLELAQARARAEHASVLLYGHTHVAHCEYRDGLYILNPGSITMPQDSTRKSYALLDVSSKGVLPSLAKL